jgi:hypothetical protein
MASSGRIGWKRSALRASTPSSQTPGLIPRFDAPAGVGPKPFLAALPICRTAWPPHLDTHALQTTRSLQPVSSAMDRTRLPVRLRGGCTTPIALIDGQVCRDARNRLTCELVYYRRRRDRDDRTNVVAGNDEGHGHHRGLRVSRIPLRGSLRLVSVRSIPAETRERTAGPEQEPAVVLRVPAIGD